MKHRLPKGYRVNSQVQLTDEVADFLNRKLAAQRGEVYVSSVQVESARPTREGGGTNLEYCSATLEAPAIHICNRYKRLSGEESGGICRERCTAWTLIKSGSSL